MLTGIVNQESSAGKRRLGCSADFPVCCIADFQSAGPGHTQRRGIGETLADWKSAIQQTGKSALRSGATLLALAVLCASLLMGSGLCAGEPVRAGSLSAQVGLSGAGTSFNPAFSADGRFVVFVSQANNLVTNDDLGLNLDVFVRELATDTTTLVSVNSTGQGGANADANYPAISADGRFVAFASAASNLVANDTNNASDVFVRDVVSGTTALVSTATNGLAPAVTYPGSTHPLISADGRWVFFESKAIGLVTNVGCGSGATDVFARDRQAGLTWLVSVKQDGTGTVNATDRSQLCSLTPEGRWVAFSSTVANLVPGQANRSGDLYVRDMQTGATLWASTNVPACFPSTAYRAFNGVLSADGRFVVFKAKANSSAPGSPALLFRHELSAGITTMITSNSTDNAWPQVSTDGRFVAYDDGTNIFVWDGQTPSNILVSVNQGGVMANGVAKAPAMTADGRLVAFLSAATDLVANVVNTNFQIYVRDVVARATRLVGVTQSGAPSTADHEFIEPAITTDGRWVAFESEDDELVPCDFNRARDVFVRDLVSDCTRLVSERHPILPALTGVQHCAVWSGNCLSADGRFLAFTSLDNTLAPGDTNGYQDIIVRDLFTGSNRLVGIWTNSVINPVLSRNGRYVAFTRPVDLHALQMPPGYPPAYTTTGYTTTGYIYCFDLANSRLYDADESLSTGSYCAASGVSDDGRCVVFQSGHTTTNIFIYDMVLDTNILVTAGLSGGGGNSSSSGAVLSPTERWILFLSLANNLATNYLSSSNPELHVYDRSDGTTRIVSRNETTALGCASIPVFGGDNLAAFVSLSSPSGSRAVYLCDLPHQTNLLVADGVINPSLSAQSSMLAYQTWQPGSPGAFTSQIVVSSLADGTTNLVSVNRAGTGPGNGNSTSPVITRDGRYVVFLSLATDLVDNDTNGVADIFVRDLVTSNTMAVTLSRRTGGTGNGVSGPPMLGADGRTVIFQSFASDLVEGDYNDKSDVFILRLGVSDTNLDGMDDDWEMAFFGTLSPDDSGDFDHDRMSDLDEFRAGTGPTNPASVLRAMTLTSLGGSSTTVLWPAVTGKTYQVQYKDDLTSTNWTALPGPIVLNGSTGSISDPTSGGQSQRFYRVVVLP